MLTAPATVKQDLKLLLDTVEQAVQLRPEIRAQLSGRVRAAIQEASRLEFQVEEQRALAEESRAAALEAERITSEVMRREERLKQLLARFNSLMAEGRFQEADVEIAEQIQEIAPELPAAVAATWNARRSMRRSRARLPTSSAAP